MKTLIISDKHGMSAAKFVQERIEQDGIERLVDLGDHDTPQALREILDLRAPKIVLIGNHDYLAANGDWEYSPMQDYFQISSGRCYSKEDAKKDYLKLWQEAERERRWVLRASNLNPGKTRGIKVVETVKDKRIVYVHGALWHDLTENEVNDIGEKLPILWGRTTQLQEVIANFNEMGEDNSWLLIKGHDHYHHLFSQDEGLQSKFSDTPESELQTPVILNPNQRHILVAGSFARGKYAILDSSNNQIEFR